MLNIMQKKLALSFLLLGDQDKAYVLGTLSDECITVLNKTLAGLERIGITSTSARYLRDDIRIAQENKYAENGLMNINLEISNFAQKNGHIPPQKLLDYIHSCSAAKA